MWNAESVQLHQFLPAKDRAQKNLSVKLNLGSDQLESNYIFQFSVLDDKNFLSRREGQGIIQSVCYESHFGMVCAAGRGIQGSLSWLLGVITSHTWMPKGNESKPKMHGAAAQHGFHCKEKRIYFIERNIGRKQEVNMLKPGGILIPLWFAFIGA